MLLARRLPPHSGCDMELAGKQALESASFDAVIIRANGEIIPLGTIAYYHRNPLRRWAWRLGRWLRGKRTGSVHMTKE